MQPRIAIVHYASPPVIGGVESVIAAYIRQLHHLEYSVRVISGEGSAFHENVEFVFDPLFAAKHPEVLAVKRDLDRGVVPSAFETLVERQRTALRAALQGCDICFVHNLHTMNKNLPLTAAFLSLRHPHVIAHCHDIAWANEQYAPELHSGFPWELLRQAQPNTRYATVSEGRRNELAGVLEIPPEQIALLPPGFDPAYFFRWTPMMEHIESKLQLLKADGLLLLPARLTRRKNIAYALHVLAALRASSGQDFRLIVTGPPGPHNPSNLGYLGELLELQSSLNLTHSVSFLYELFDRSQTIDDATMTNLYQIADALIFPSIQEGFGIPILEAGMVGLPIFCADIPPFHETGQDNVTYFDPMATPAAQVAASIYSTLSQSSTARLRVHVRQHFRWESIVKSCFIPLLEAL